MFLKIRTPISHNSDLPFIPAPIPSEFRPGDDINSITASRPSGPPSPAFIDTVNQFGFQLHHLTATPNSPNGVSALNIYHCLMMAAAGSKGRNLAGFGKALGFDPTALQDALESTLQLDTYCKRGSSNRVELTSASSVWYSQSIVLEREWSNIMSTRFQAMISPQDADSINRWVSLQTKGKITEVVTDRTVSDGNFTLITCLYFKAIWAKPFATMSTRQEMFHGFQGKMTPSSMMHKTENMLYWEDNVAQMCVLPYQSSNATETPSQSPFRPPPQELQWKAAIILPNDSGPAALSAILSHFSSSPALRSLLEPHGAHPSSSGVQSQTVHLSLPRFTLKSSVDLAQALCDQGLEPAFRASMDFSPITRSGPSSIVRVRHDLFVQVNEEGTEVAAATTTTLFTGPPSQPVEMKVNRPFLFLIFDDVTKLVLCSAVVSNVTA